MNYNYDYRFLSRFMRENKLTKKDLLEALGVTDYVSRLVVLHGRRQWCAQ